MMVSPVIAILTWIHIISAVGWIGGGFYEIFIAFPLIESIPAEAKKAAFRTAFRRLPVYYIFFGTATIVSGPALFIEMGGSFDLSNLWNVLIVSGGLLGLTAWVIARVVDFGMGPRMMKQIEEGKFPRMKQVMAGAAFGMVVVLVAFTMMVTAALI